MVNPKDYGIDLDNEAFADAAVGDFNNFIRGAMSLDEMLLRPRTALHFCDTTRQRHGWYDLPDDILLRTIINRRKSPTG
jgi:hypothetical protein